METEKPKIRECCKKCENRDKPYTKCYNGKFCGKCPSLMQGKNEPPIFEGN